MSENLASVIIPVHNSARWATDLAASISRNLESIGEVILINDGGKEEFRTVQEHLQVVCGQKLKVCYTRGDEGPAVARNVGLTLARFPIISFLDSDDVWIADSLKRRIEALKHAEGSCAFVSSSFFKMKEDGTLTNHIRVPRISNAGSLLVTNHIFLSSVVVKRELLADIRFSRIGHEDLLFWVRLIASSGLPVLGLDSPLCFMRTTKGSVSSKKLSAAHWYWNIISHLSFPLLLRFGLFFMYGVNGVAKRFFPCYRPVYCGLNSAAERRIDKQKLGMV